jgi:hypothetical protein
MKGAREIERALRKMPNTAAKKAIRPALRSSAKRLKQHVIENLSGSRIGVRTGRLRGAFAAHAKVRVARYGSDVLAIGVSPPTQDELGISDERQRKWYIPWALEYGTVERRGPRGRITERRYIRDAVDRHRGEELGKIKIQLGREVENQWRRLARTR